MSKSVYFRFEASPEVEKALERACAAEYLSLANFGRQAIHNELIRRHYMRGRQIGKGWQINMPDAPVAMGDELAIPFAEPEPEKKETDPF